MFSVVTQTVLAGVLVFVLGQLFLELVLKPLQEIRRLIGQVSFSLGYYANQLTAGPKCDEARDQYRQLACKLREALGQAHLVRFFSILGVIPSEENIVKASSALIGLSNYPREGEPRDYPAPREEIKKLLDIKNY